MAMSSCCPGEFHLHTGSFARAERNSKSWIHAQVRRTYRCLGIQASSQPLSSGSKRLSSKQPGESPSRIPYGLVTGLSAAGVVETAYLTWIKFFGGSPVCLVSTGPSCNNVLNSGYSTLYGGVPLSLVGLVAYSGISILGYTMLQGMFAEDSIRWLFLGGTSAMAAASGYFMYLLAYKLDGASCTYCVASALLSLGLFLSTLRGFKWKDALQVAGVQLVVGALVIVTLSTAFAGNSTALAGSEDIDLPPIEPEVTTSSDATKISLAKHLKSIGAKMYGAFWCSHCHEQKQELGKEAVNIIDYIECFPDGYRKGVKIAKACEAAKIEGFPTWIINGEAYAGELSLDELAKAAKFNLDSK